MRIRNAPSMSLVLTLVCITLSSARAEVLEVPGTGDGMRVLQALSKAFSVAHPAHVVNIPESSGSSGGIKAVGHDKARLARVARPIKVKEKPFGLSYLPIAKFPVVFFVNSSVNVSGLSAEQINGIYSGKITNWKSVGGSEGKIRVVRRENGDSSLRSLRATFPGFADLKITKYSKITTTAQYNLDTVATTRGAIGFGPYADALDAKVNILSIEGRKPVDHGYPSHVILALVFKEENNTGVVSAFINFVSSPDSRELIESAQASQVETVIQTQE